MICPNEQCKKTFDYPLEIYNGALLCPFCKKELITIGKIEINAQNEEQYKTSEFFLLSYLSKEESSLGDGAKTVKDKEELLENAINYCLQAAKGGNPLAIYRMGFYNEYYYRTTKTELERAKTAYEYYSALCFEEKTSVVIKKGCTQLSNDEFYKLKRLCAICLVGLFEKYGKYLNEKNGVNAENDLKRITSLYDGIDVKDWNKKTTVNNAEKVFAVLESCFSKERAPLFGVFLLSGSDYIQLCSLKGSKNNKVNFNTFISKRLELRYAFCDESGRIDDKDRYFKNIASVKIAKDIADTVSPNEKMYLFFFNTKGKHKYLNNKQMLNVRKDLTGEDFALLYRLVQSESQEYLFFDDDIERFKKGKSTNNCVEELIDKICGEM